jgi:hypothetical protein
MAIKGGTMDTAKGRSRRRRSRDNSMLSATDIAALGKVDQAAVERCIREDPRFPEPVAHRSTGELYDRTSVYKWAIEAGLEALEPGLRTVRSH